MSCQILSVINGLVHKLGYLHNILKGSWIICLYIFWPDCYLYKENSVYDHEVKLMLCLIITAITTKHNLKHWSETQLPLVKKTALSISILIKIKNTWKNMLWSLTSDHIHVLSQACMRAMFVCVSRSRMMMMMTLMTMRMLMMRANPDHHPPQNYHWPVVQHCCLPYFASLTMLIVYSKIVFCPGLCLHFLK